MKYSISESSDELEDMGLGAIGAAASDSEDNWEELSDMAAEDENSSSDDLPTLPRKRGRDSESNGVADGKRGEEQSMSDSDGD